MQIEIKSRDFSITDSLRDYAERRLHFTLSSTSQHINKVVMRLSDINGPRGGEDKRCRLHILLNGLPDAIIEDTESDMYIAINRAADRAGRSILRKVRRKQSLGRQARNHTAFAEISPMM